MDTVLEERLIKKSQKERYCDACLFINNHFSFKDLLSSAELEDSELSTIVRMKGQGFKILVGQPYIRNTFIADGYFSVWRCDPEMFEIYIKYIASSNRD
jgi:hypothetical protein